MQIVIDIAENVKKQIDDGKGETEFGIPLWLAYSISKGTPLPKGRGRLIDEAEILKFLRCPKYEDCDWKNCSDCNKSRCIDFNSIKSLVSMIEADKDESK